MASDTYVLKVLVDDKGKVKIKRVSDDLKKFDKQVGVTTAKTEKKFAGMWKQVAAGQIAFQLARKGLRVLEQAIGAVTDELLSFDDEFANVTTLMDTSVEITDKMKTGILEMAGSLGSATELTKGMYQALSASVEPAKSLEFLADTARFAKAGLIEMGSAVDVVTTVINAYGMEVEDTVHITDVLFETVKRGKITGQELASSLGMVIPSAVTLGIELEQVTAALATMTKAGISASESVVAINQVMMAILKPTEDAVNAVNELNAANKGLNLQWSKAGIQAAGGFQQFLVKVKEAVGDNETMMARLVPSVRALKAAFTLTGAGAADFAEQFKNMHNVTDNVTTAFEKQQASLKKLWEGIRNQFIAILVTELLPVLERVKLFLNENREEVKLFFQSFSRLIGDLATKIADFVANGLEKFIAQLGEIYKAIELIVGMHTKVYEIYKLLAGVGLKSLEILAKLGAKGAGMVAPGMGAMRGDERLLSSMDMRRNMMGGMKGLMPTMPKIGTADLTNLGKVKELFNKNQAAAIKAAQANEKYHASLFEGLKNLPTERLIDYTEEQKSSKDVMEEMIPLPNILTEELDVLITTNQSAAEKNRIHQESLRSLGETLYGVANIAGSFGDLLEQIGIDTKGIFDGIGQSVAGIGEFITATSPVEKIMAGIEIAKGVIKTIGGIIDTVFGNKWDKAIKKHTEWMNLTEEQNESLKELAKEVGSVQKATNMMLAEFIDTAEITTENFNEWAGRVGDILKDYNRGLMTLADTQKHLGESFASLISKAKKLGMEGSKPILDIIRNLRQQGIEVAEVTEYINEQLVEGAQGLNKYWETAIDTQEEFSRAVGYTLSLFNAMIQNGMSAVEAMAAVGGALKKAMELMEKHGFKATEAFKKLLKFQKLVAENTALIESIQALNDVLEALGNTANLTFEDFTAFQEDALSLYNQLINAGFSQEQALQQIAPLLDNLLYYANAYGFALSANIQKLIDLADKQGLLTKSKIPAEEKQVMLLEAILKTLGGTVPYGGVIGGGSPPPDPRDPETPPIGCFTGYQGVLTTDGYKQIKNIKVGDKVLSYNAEKDNCSISEVEEVIVHNGVNKPMHDFYKIPLLLIGINIEGDVEYTEVTANHLYYDPIGKQWKPIASFKIGDQVQSINCRGVVISKRVLSNRNDVVYDLHMKKSPHNYIVNDVVVHNKLRVPEGGEFALGGEFWTDKDTNIRVHKGEHGLITPDVERGDQPIGGGGNIYYISFPLSGVTDARSLTDAIRYNKEEIQDAFKEVIG